MAAPSQTKSRPIGLRAKLRDYWRLTKSLQTGLLLITAMAGLMSSSTRCPLHSCSTIMALLVTMFLAISGSTILNMVYDRDIDTKMKRTANRPLPSGRVAVAEAQVVGMLFVILGVGGAFALFPLYGLVVFAGLFFDIVIYTMWLKRRTSWSIVWGGIAGGMPILAGRALGTGEIDVVGVLLAVGVLLWVPTHIVTYGIKYASDYQAAGVPTFANTHGEHVARKFVSMSTMMAVLSMTAAAWLIELQAGCLYATISLGTVLAGLTIVGLLFPSPKLNFGIFKSASLYMLGSMILIMLGA